MELEWNLICKFLYEADLLKLREAGIDSSFFTGQCKTVWNFIEEHYRDYREIPSIELIQERFGVTVVVPKETLDYWIDEIKNKNLEEDLSEIAIQVNDIIGKGKPADALDALTQFCRQQNKRVFRGSAKAVKAASLKEQILKAYHDAKMGKMGVPTPWKKLNEWTMGWWKKDISTLVARSGTGKTFFMLDLAIASLEANYETLFISCEMATRDIGQRYFAKKFKKQYGALRKGRLSTFDENALKQLLNDYDPLHDLEIQDGSQGLNIVDIERAIERTEADLILVDSCYRIKARQKTKDRFDNMALVFEDLKLFSQMYDKAIVTSTQFNRDYSKKKMEDADMSDIALSDVIAWTSTNILSLGRTDEDKLEQKMRVFPMKIREAENTSQPMILNWDMTTMNFTEVNDESEENYHY